MIDQIDMEDSKERITPDWERVEADYRAGILSLRAIAAKHGPLTEGSIRKRARKHEWARDLKARIRAKAEELVRNQLVRSVGPQYATASEPSERAIVQDNAQVLAHAELTQRRDISKAREIVVSLFAELEAVTGKRLIAELPQDPIGNLEYSRDNDKTAYRPIGAFNKPISLPAMAGMVKALADALRTLVMLEREVWGMGMDDGRAAPVEKRNVIDSSKLTSVERQQLRALIMKADPDSSREGDAASVTAVQSHEFE